VKGVQANDLRGNDPEELRRTVRKLEEDLFKNRLKKNTNQLENTMLIRNTRRDIARVNTVLAERARVGGAAPAVSPVGTGEAPAAQGKGKATKTKRAAKKQTSGKEQET
jgi:large subunit ribosomal protein L29